MVAASDKAYEVAKNAYMSYGWFLQEAAADIGWEKTIAIHGRAGVRMAETLTGILRADHRDRRLDTGRISAALKTLFERMGAGCEILASEKTVTAVYQRCPLYDGLAASGIEHATIHRVCAAFGGNESRRLQQILPELTMTGRFRKSAGGTCIEEFTLGPIGPA